MAILVNSTPIESFNFKGGECQVKIINRIISGITNIYASLNSSDDIMRLLLTVDAVRRIRPETEINLIIPYLPYARQDRVCNPGEALSIKVMADLINGLKCTNVTIFDPHSEVTPALLDRCITVSLPDIIENSILSDIIKSKYLCLVSPDAGAEKKTRELGKRLSTDNQKITIFYASKTRDTLTGEILSTEINANVEGKDLIIIDDICDGGRTFIELSKLLLSKGANSVYLYITHGIFSQGLDVLKPYFKHIYCAHTMLLGDNIDKAFLTTFS